MSILERFASGLSPIAGGLLALFLWSRIGYGCVCGTFPAFGAYRCWPQLSQPNTRASCNFRKFPLRSTWRSLVAEGSYRVRCIYYWYCMVVVSRGCHVFIGHGRGVRRNRIFGIDFVVCRLYTSYMYGKLIDRPPGWAIFSNMQRLPIARARRREHLSRHQSVRC